MSNEHSDARLSSFVSVPVATPLGDDTEVSRIFTQSGRNLLALEAAVDVESPSTILNRSHQQHNRRAALVSVDVSKPISEAPLGIRLQRSDQGQLEVTQLDPEGLIGCSGTICPLHVGDSILSINNRDVQDLAAVDAGKLLRGLVGSVRLVARSPSGNPKHIESMIEKPNPSSMVGLGFSSRGSKVVIGSVKGLLESSLVNTGDAVVSINNGPSPRTGRWYPSSLGVSHHICTASEAKEMILASPRFVSIRTETLEGNGVCALGSL